jgi:predicted TIM-barrel fold metal-dependent hydrolase
MPTRIIDIHPHIISTDTQRYPLSPLGGEQSSWSRTRPVTFEQLIAAMDAAGVEKAAIVHSSTTYGYDNAYVADAVALKPERFTGVFSVDVLAPDAPEKIRYWVKRKLSGLRLFTTGSTMPGQAGWLEDPRLLPAWECAGELGIAICVQMTSAAIPQLEKLLKRYPAIPVVIDHLMKPPIEDGPPYAGANFLFALARYPNVYLKLTTRNVVDARKGKATPETFFRRLVKEFGASRIAWGSNYPASEGTLAAFVTQAKEALASLPQQDQEWIFHRTAEKLYPALSDKRSTTL